MIQYNTHLLKSILVASNPESLWFIYFMWYKIIFSFKGFLSLSIKSSKQNIVHNEAWYKLVCISP